MTGILPCGVRACRAVIRINDLCQNDGRYQLPGNTANKAFMKRLRLKLKLADADSSSYHQCQYPRLAAGPGRRLPAYTLVTISRYTGLQYRETIFSHDTSPTTLLPESASLLPFWATLLPFFATIALVTKSPFTATKSSFSATDVDTTLGF